jgi:hypothetical protein
MPSREWCEAEGRWRYGVLVEDGRDGEPTAEEALLLAMTMLAAALPVDLTDNEQRALQELGSGEAWDIEALAVLRRSIESDTQ